MAYHIVRCSNNSNDNVHQNCKQNHKILGQSPGAIRDEIIRSSENP